MAIYFEYIMNYVISPQLQWHLLNMNAIFNQCFDNAESNAENTGTRVIGLVNPKPGLDCKNMSNQYHRFIAGS